MKNKLGVSRNVFILGLVSFFNDIASEMIYPIVPIFLTSVLQAPASVVGLIEGIAESTASLLKAFSGWFSDKLKKRKIFYHRRLFPFHLFQTNYWFCPKLASCLIRPFYGSLWKRH